MNGDKSSLETLIDRTAKNPERYFPDCLNYTPMPLKKKKPEIKVIEQAQAANEERAYKVNAMEDLVHNFDVQKILNLNEKLRAYYEKKEDEETLELLDRMTVVMNEVREIIDQVKAKRISLEQGQREKYRRNARKSMKYSV